MYDHVDNDDKLLLFERWSSKEDLERHLRSNHYRFLLEVLELSEEEPIAEIISVSDIEMLDQVLSYRID